MSEPCKYCGAYSRRSCEWEDMTGVECGAPCEFDDDAFGLDPDRLREDRDDERSLGKEPTT
jgi:hypothetical protein